MHVTHVQQTYVQDMNFVHLDHILQKEHDIVHVYITSYKTSMYNGADNVTDKLIVLWY